MEKVNTQPAYVLHGRHYRESSQLLEVLTRDHGRVGLIARGARGAKSRWKGMLQPFRPLLLNWSRRGDLGTLTGADQVAAPPPLLGEALYCGLYVNELTLRFMQRWDPHPEVFEDYRETLSALASGDNPQPLLRLFEKHVLESTGYGLILDREPASGAPVQSDAWYQYRPDRGPVRVGESGRDRPGVVSGAALLALDADEVSREHWASLRTLMRQVLRHHLGDKPLASESLYRKRSSGKGRSSNTQAVKPAPVEKGTENE